MHFNSKTKKIIIALGMIIIFLFGFVKANKQQYLLDTGLCNKCGQLCEKYVTNSTIKCEMNPNAPTVSVEERLLK